MQDGNIARRQYIIKEKNNSTLRFKLNIDWKKTLLMAADGILVIYLMLVFVSWHKPKERNIKCTKVVIRIEDEHNNVFLDEKEVKKLLEKYDLYPIAKPVSSINIRDIEQRLVKMPFVKTAQCYVNQSGHAYVSITQRTPVIRVKASSGDDYYIDDNGGVMPNSQYTSDIIVATGAIDRRFAIKYIYNMARTLMADDFWRNQIVQINVRDDHSIEIVPRVGDHIINIGILPVSNGRHRPQMIEDYVKKQMNRLQLFYTHGLCHAGWKKYDYISLEFSNQIVCRRRKSEPEKQVTIETTAETKPAEQNSTEQASTSAASQTSGQEQKKNEAKPEKDKTKQTEKRKV